MIRRRLFRGSLIQEEASVGCLGKTMRCSNCGLQNPEEKKFCSDCRAPLANIGLQHFAARARQNKLLLRLACGIEMEFPVDTRERRNADQASTLMQRSCHRFAW
jgi:hypothetical protein